MIETNVQPATIGFDASCRRCGYNLRGLFANGRCPECNTSIAESLVGNLLQFSDPAWLQRISKGLSVRFWGLLTMILAYFLSMCVFPAFMLALLPGAVFNIAGGWVFTSPESGIIDPSRDPKSRRFARLALALLVISFVIEIQLPFGLVFFAGGIQWIILIGMSVSELFMLHYSKTLAERARNPDLARFTRTVMVALGLSIGLLIAALVTVNVGFTIQRAAPPSSSGGFIMGSPNISFHTIQLIIGGLLMLATFIACLYTAIRLLMLIHRLRKFLEGIVRNAQTTPINDTVRPIV